MVDKYKSPIELNSLSLLDVADFVICWDVDEATDEKMKVITYDNLSTQVIDDAINDGVDNNVARYDGTKKIQPSNVIIDDSDNISTSGSITAGESNAITSIGNGSIELSTPSGVSSIDFKSAAAEDFDCRIAQNTDGLDFYTGGDAAALIGLSIDLNQNVSVPNGNLSVGGDLTVTGDLTVNGSAFQAFTETVNIEDNLLVINNGETGAGVTAGASGIEVDRGTETNYRFIFDETSDSFRIGEDGSLQPVATREDSPNNNYVPIWNTTTQRFETVGGVDISSILTTEDEGSGGGIDADSVDGLEASQFLRSDTSDSFDGTLTVTGDVGIGAVTTPLVDLHLSGSNGATLRFSDIGAATDTEVNSTIEWYRGLNDNRVAYIYCSSADSNLHFTNSIVGGNAIFELSGGGIYEGANRVLTTANEGSGNGIDSDTVDGLEASQFLRSDTSDSFDGNKLTLGYVGRKVIEYNNSGWADPTAPGSDSTGDKIVLYNTSTTKTAIGFGAANDIWFQTHGNNAGFEFWTGVSEVAPTKKFDIANNGMITTTCLAGTVARFTDGISQIDIDVSDSGYNLIGTNTNHDLWIQVYNQLVCKFDTNKNVLVPNGTFSIGSSATPSAKFEIRNNIGSDCIRYTSPDITHGITGTVDTDVYYQHQLHSNGGNVIRYFSDSDYTPITIHGIFGIDDPTDSYAAIQLTASKKSGTSQQGLSSTENVFKIDNWGLNVFAINGGGDLTITGKLTAANVVGSHDDITATSEGVAASVSTETTFVTTNGDSDLDNVTLADGTEGQTKYICCVAEGNAADTWKITPTNMIGGTQITFSGVGQGCTLKMYSSGWVVVGNNGGTIS